MTYFTMLRQRIAWLVWSTKFKLENAPIVFLNVEKLQYVDSFKYIGMFIHVCNDDLDIVRQLLYG